MVKPTTLGAFLRKAREDFDTGRVDENGEKVPLSRGELAEWLGWSPSAVSNLELGYNDVPREKLPALLSALRVAEDEWPAVLRLPIAEADAAPTEAV